LGKESSRTEEWRKEGHNRELEKIASEFRIFIFVGKRSDGRQG